MAGQGNPRTERVAELQGEGPNRDLQFRISSCRGLGRCKQIEQIKVGVETHLRLSRSKM